jgi:hypothetical protein
MIVTDTPEDDRNWGRSGVGRHNSGAARPHAARLDHGPGIDPHAGLEPQWTVDPTPKPGILDFRDLVLTAFPETSNGGISRPGDRGGQSEHKEGRAWDWRVCSVTQVELVEALFDWLFATDRYGNAHALARRWGLMYVIYDRRIWGAYLADQGWRPYAGADPHVDHVHFSFSWAGALRRTSWWEAVASSPGGAC